MALCEARTPRRAALTPAQSLRTAHGGFWALLGRCPPCASGRTRRPDVASAPRTAWRRCAGRDRPDRRGADRCSTGRRGVRSGRGRAESGDPLRAGGVVPAGSGWAGGWCGGSSAAPRGRCARPGACPAGGCLIGRAVPSPQAAASAGAEAGGGVSARAGARGCFGRRIVGRLCPSSPEGGLQYCA